MYRQVLKIRCCIKNQNHLLSRRLFSSDDKSSNNIDKLETQDKTSGKLEKNKISDKDSQENASKKILSLLSEIQKMTSDKSGETYNLNLAKPVKRISKKERILQMEKEKETPKDEVKEALKAITNNLQEDAKSIEKELDEKLVSLNLTEPAPEKLPKPQDEQMSEIAENLIPPVKEVATTIFEKPIPSRSELTTRLLRLSLDKEVSPKKAQSVLSLIENMKPQSLKKEQTRVQKNAFHRKTKTIKEVNLFGSPPLNIFNLNSETATEYKSPLWQAMQERELRLMTQFAPENPFEEMIMWTEQGKHWKFPIDNETEMGEEESIGFHEHVFLDRHLKGFPTKGPIRHFMELVVVGLSKNPYITVERKIENIEWFRNYFKEKEDVLKDCGVLS